MNLSRNGEDTPVVTTKNTLALYIVCLVVTVLIAAAGLLTGNAGDLILTVPMIIILIMTIFSDKEFIHIPPAMVFLMVATFLIAAIARIMDGYWMGVLACFMWGINLELIGIVCVFMIMKSESGISVQSSKLVLPVSIAIAVSIFMMIMMLQYYLSLVWDLINPVELDRMMNEVVLVTLGALLIGVLYTCDRTRNLFKLTVGSFLEKNSDKEGVEAKRRQMVIDTIKAGESDKLEFKSTLRTNLQTGETDKRMEKAVLKTIVAFLNTDGGTLMVGVSDDATICGIDLESFDNKDKLNLHFTNMLSSSIGNEYLPYIKFHLIDFEDGKSVLRVTCYKSKKPVFLKEGKNEIFYVRSGPSSVELTGRNLINYVNNRSKKSREAILQSAEE